MEISKDERELYDRQIRLWGLEGQNRLRKSRILVLGMGAVAVELVKNLCLAGVGSVTLQSTETVMEDDLSYNFFLDSRSLSQNAAEASSLRAQRLNPRVAVTTETRLLDQLTDAYFSEFDVVVATQITDKTRLIAIDEVTRRSKCAFYYAILQGWGGLLFVDLGDQPYQFVVEKEIPLDQSQTGPVSATKTILSSQPPTKESGNSLTKLTVTERYISLDEAWRVGSQFGQSMKVRHRNKVSPYLPAFLALLDHPESPDIVAKTRELGLPEQLITPQFVDSFNAQKNVQISGMSSVLGGTLSQEVINFLTMREYPIQNTHVYDGLDGKGPQYYLSP